MSKPPRLLIVDQSLLNTSGHHYEYDLSIIHAANQAGIQPVLASNKRMLRTLDFHDTQVLPIFTQGWSEAHRGLFSRLFLRIAESLPETLARQVLLFARRLKNLVAPASHMANADTTPSSTRHQTIASFSRAPIVEFGRELLDVIHDIGLGQNDHVFIHTTGLHELDSLLESLSEPLLLAGPTLHVVLRRDPYENTMASGSRGGIAITLSRTLPLASRTRKLKFYTDTEQLASAYRGITPEIEIRVIPIIQEMPALPPTSGAQNSGQPLRILYAGNARMEKGFNLLPAAAQAIKERYLETGRAQMIIQANDSVVGGEVGIYEARQKLSAYPGSQIKLINHPLSVPDFHRLILQSDIVLLPYGADAYRNRSSGILLQALITGKVVVVPANTWLSAQITEETGRSYDTPDAFPQALISAIENIGQLSLNARAEASSWRERHETHHLISALMSPADPRQ